MIAMAMEFRAMATKDEWPNVANLTRGFCGGIPGPGYEPEPPVVDGWPRLPSGAIGFCGGIHVPLDLGPPLTDEEMNLGERGPGFDKGPPQFGPWLLPPILPEPAPRSSAPISRNPII